VDKAFRALIEDASGEERRWREQVRVIFLTVIGAGLRRVEVLGLRWWDVSLADPAGPTLRVRETWVRSGRDTPKSEAGERTIALGNRLASELFDHRARTAYGADDDRGVLIADERHPVRRGPLLHDAEGRAASGPIVTQ
jgi:integrase